MRVFSLYSFQSCIGRLSYRQPQDDITIKNPEDHAYTQSLDQSCISSLWRELRLIIVWIQMLRLVEAVQAISAFRVNPNRKACISLTKRSHSLSSQGKCLPGLEGLRKLSPDTQGRLSAHVVGVLCLLLDDQPLSPVTVNRAVKDAEHQRLDTSTPPL